MRRITHSDWSVRVARICWTNQRTKNKRTGTIQLYWVASCAFLLLFYPGVLTRLKIVCLENEKREAKKKYLDSQKMYVKEMLGRPMEKLNVRINSGIYDKPVNADRFCQLFQKHPSVFAGSKGTLSWICAFSLRVFSLSVSFLLLFFDIEKNPFFFSCGTYTFRFQKGVNSFRWKQNKNKLLHRVRKKTDTRSKEDNRQCTDKQCL